MNILQVNCVYGTGSTGNITRDLHRTFLALGHQSTVLYGRGPRVQEPFTSRVCSNWYGRVQGLAARIGGLPYGHCAWSSRQLLGQIRRIQPDVVHLQCLNGHFCNLYHLLTYLKEIQIPTVLTLHAEFPYTGGCSHAGTCTGFQQRCTGCTRATPETACLLGNRAEASWLQLRSIYPGWDRLSVVGCSRWIARRAAAASALAGIPSLSFPTASIPEYSSPGSKLPLNCGNPCPSHPASGSFSLPPQLSLMAKGLTCFWTWSDPAHICPSGFLPPATAKIFPSPTSPSWATSPAGSKWPFFTLPPTLWSCAAGKTTSPPSAWRLPPAVPLW